MTQSDARFRERLQGFVGRQYGAVYAWDTVDKPMIRHWCDALGFSFGPYVDDKAAAESVHGQIVAPATMLQVWLMPGLSNARPSGSDMANPREIMPVLEDQGYTGILGTDCEQEYFRYLRLGERISTTHAVESVSEEKQTRFGAGFFVTFLQKYHDETGDLVGTMRLRILRFRPKDTSTGEALRRASPPQPGVSSDTQFFWDGLKQNKLLIQRCTACGKLRHPPGPVCITCHSLEWDSVESSGLGTLFSFVMMHQPKYESFDYPHPVGLIDLDEGVRLVAPLTQVKPDAIEIGMRLESVFDIAEGENRLPLFRPAPERSSHS